MNSVLIRNRSGYRGAAVYCTESNWATFRNTIIAFSEGAPALFFWDSPWCRFEHCDFFGNWGNFDYWTSAEEDAPPGLGLIDTINVNSDSCDTYMNMYLDPLLRDIENEDYHLMWTQCGDSADSPCIDAGDPTIHDHTLDCDWGLGTLISDIGLYGGDTVISGISYPSSPILPDKPTLFQNFPNPFNPVTAIQFDVPKTAKVELKVYNILGQEVATLTNEVLPAGTHRVLWNATSLPSGIYIYHLKVGNFVDAKKMVFVR
ncbi:MAG: T9SS type A sorting domain-containing protein [bacterium]